MTDRKASERLDVVAALLAFDRVRSDAVSCRQCGRAWTSYEEKETDVNIAVAFVPDARRPPLTSP